MVLIIFAGLVLWFWFMKRQSTSKSEHDSNNGRNFDINITDAIIPSQERDIKLKLIDGEYRYFQNYYINGVQYTFGFPKQNCPDKRVWIGRGTIEVERISLTEAQRRISDLNFDSSNKYFS